MACSIRTASHSPRWAPRSAIIVARAVIVAVNSHNRFERGHGARSASSAAAEHGSGQ